MSIALIIVDMQETIVRDKLDQQTIDHACEYINHVADQLRTNQHVVVHVQDVEGMDEAGREQLHFIPEVDLRDVDYIITKESSNAFWQTELEQLLESNGVKLVIIAGFAAEECVLFTYNGARERGFKAVMLQNGVLSTHAEAITTIYRDRNVISYPVVEYLVRS